MPTQTPQPKPHSHSTKSSSTKVNIRPNVSMLSVLQFLEYETWYALAEYVDNSIASYQANEAKLKELEGDGYKLEVSIEINEAENRIVIRDNAAGIEEANYARAFRAAEVPAETSGLSEFGMGMKSASCWFSDQWIVRTTALDEPIEKTIKFDMNRIFEDKLEELDVMTRPVNANHHYTIIELNNVHRIPRGRAKSKVKMHLASIYRAFIRKGILKLKVDEELKYHEPKILHTRFHEKPYVPVGESILWKKVISFPIDEGLSVRGFVALREVGSTAEAGFALFRRGRVIEGSYDNGFRPDFIFGAPNSYSYQRIFGELHLEGFDVSFTKKGIQWDEHLQMFLELLRDDISSPEFPLLQQAENYRVRAKEADYKAATKALEHTINDLRAKAPQAMQEVAHRSPLPVEPEELLSPSEKVMHKEFKVKFNNTDWLISIELSYDASLTELIEVGNHLIRNQNGGSAVRQVGIRLSLTHPFMIQFAGAESAKIEPILRMIAAMGLAEIIAKSSNAKGQGEIRRNFNELISKLSNS